MLINMAKALLVLFIFKLLLADLACGFLWGSPSEKVQIKKHITGTAYYINTLQFREQVGLPAASARDKRSLDNKPTISSLYVKSKINARFAQTSISSKMANMESINQEAKFKVQIPDTAFISNFTMLVDGEWQVAEVKGKKEAEKAYEEAQRANKTAGIVSSDPDKSNPERGMEFFSVTVNVRAYSSVEFELTYLQLLVRRLGVYEQRISIRPHQVVLEMKVDAEIYEPQGIKFIDVSEPSAGTNSIANVIAEVIQSSAEVKMVTYYPTVQQQKDMNEKTGINGDLVIRYDTEHPYDAGLIQFENDYFVHFFSPNDPNLVPLNKNVIFVIDISGSMSGIKMEQTGASMQAILEQLRKDDKFMLLLFDDKPEYWPNEKVLVQAHADNIIKAQRYAKDNLVADGGTNINDAMLEACRILKNQGSAGANMIVFLTDGEPTVGVTSRSEIINNVARDSAGQVAVFSLGYGYNLDFDLLAGVSYKTGGFARRIYDGVDAATQLKNFFEEINTPLAYSVEVVYDMNEVNLDSITMNKFPQYFNGSEIIVAGKMRKSAPKSLNAKVKFVTNVPQELVKAIDTHVPMTIPPVAAQAYQPGFLEKLYVYKKIKDLLLTELVTDDEKAKEDINNYALKLALDYNLVTPLTSMIIVQPDRNTDMYEEDFAFAGNYPTKSYNKGSGTKHLTPFACLLLACFTISYHLEKYPFNWLI